MAKHHKNSLSALLFCLFVCLINRCLFVVVLSAFGYEFYSDCFWYLTTNSAAKFSGALDFHFFRLFDFAKIFVGSQTISLCQFSTNRRVLNSAPTFAKIHFEFKSLQLLLLFMSDTHLWTTSTRAGQLRVLFLPLYVVQ